MKSLFLPTPALPGSGSAGIISDKANALPPLVFFAYQSPSYLSISSSANIIPIFACLKNQIDFPL